MSPALEAHLRLSAVLPSRRHEWIPMNLVVEQGYKRTEREQVELKRVLKECEAKGMSRREMRVQLRIGDKTIQKALGRGKHGWPKGRPRK